MQDLKKVHTRQIFDMWKGVSIGILVIILVIVASRILPFYMAPIAGLLGALYLYTMLYSNKRRSGVTCMLIPYALFFNLISYSFASILANVIYIWGIWHLPDEFVFFNDPYIPTLWMNPIAFFTFLVIYLRGSKLRLCIDCKISNGAHTDRGVFGSIINHETRFQLKNFLFFSGVLTLVVWVYYILKYEDINTNARDRYVFFWITVIGLILDEIYFMYRYYNLYLDLKDNNELLTDADINDMTAKTYLRYYVICGNKVFLQNDIPDIRNSGAGGLDTPFFTTRSVNGVSQAEVKDIVKKMTGGHEGELKFFFGRKTPDLDKYNLIRYFYFIDGDPANPPKLDMEGEWMDFDEVKMIYSKFPKMMAIMAMNDLTRLATIILTEKVYNEQGERKMKIKSYRPTFDLEEVRKSKLDFQGDKWIRIAVFNSDDRFYKFKLWIKRLLQRGRRPTRKR